MGEERLKGTERTLIPPSCACARAAGGATPDILRLFGGISSWIGGEVMLGQSVACREVKSQSQYNIPRSRLEGAD